MKYIVIVALVAAILCSPAIQRAYTVSQSTADQAVALETARLQSMTTYASLMGLSDALAYVGWNILPLVALGGFVFVVMRWLWRKGGE